MVSERKLTGRATSIPAGLAFGAGVSIVTTIIICAVSAHLITKEVIGQNNMGYCAIIAMLTATILGGMTASGKVKRRKPTICLLSGGSYFTVLIAITALFFGGYYRGMGITFLVILIGSCASALLVVRKKNTAPMRKRKKTHH